jgi:hypothetical protein
MNFIVGYISVAMDQSRGDWDRHRNGGVPEGKCLSRRGLSICVTLSQLYKHRSQVEVELLKPAQGTRVALGHQWLSEPGPLLSISSLGWPVFSSESWL